jgi:hypothetical protein
MLAQLENKSLLASFSSEKEESVLFLKKRTKKTFIPGAATGCVASHYNRGLDKI